MRKALVELYGLLMLLISVPYLKIIMLIEMNKVEISKLISEYQSMIEQLQERLINLEKEFDASEYVGKYFIQDRYESGVRFMYVLDAEESTDEDEIDFYGYGADYDEQFNTLEFFDEGNPTWFGNVKYGTLEEVSKEEFNKRITELVLLKIYN